MTSYHAYPQEYSDIRRNRADNHTTVWAIRVDPPPNTTNTYYRWDTVDERDFNSNDMEMYIDPNKPLKNGDYFVAINERRVEHWQKDAFEQNFCPILSAEQTGENYIGLE